MKTPSPQEAAKMEWAEEIAKSCIVYDDEEGCYISASRCRIEAALLEADKNGYERGRQEGREEAFRDVEWRRKPQEDNACGAAFHRKDINCPSTCGRKKGHTGTHSWFRDPENSSK